VVLGCTVKLEVVEEVLSTVVVVTFAAEEVLQATVEAIPAPHVLFDAALFVSPP
jgi:hypothetical protein